MYLVVGSTAVADALKLICPHGMPKVNPDVIQVFSYFLFVDDVILNDALL